MQLQELVRRPDDSVILDSDIARGLARQENDEYSWPGSGQKLKAKTVYLSSFNPRECRSLLT